MIFDLTGKTAIVTGAGSGIGEAIALLFARQGARIVAFDISETAASQVATKIRTVGGEARAYTCDVGDAASVASAFGRVFDWVKRIDILVNNAGIAHVGTAENTDESAFDNVSRVNIKGVFLCARAAIPRMRAQGGGVILNMASVASLMGLEERFAYSASKGAVLAMTRSIATDTMRANIRCNCICPARVHTPFVDQMIATFHAGEEAATFEKLSKSQPLGRMAKPEEVAALALYLCSDEASFITGQAFPIDGGMLVR
jgi:NAD(P)-dependent dehydrogenase (short-subunit alcohol dehydrogenase family)